jgi:acyl-CoA reductase-like NAD-dependent aldehyde dehydrogenase
MAARQEDLGRTISAEEGKIIAEGRLEANRAYETIMGSAEEAKRLHGETVPLDGAPGGAGKFGVTIRVPCGVVVAISPFNFPLNLVCHKVGPALAGGNAVIVKPATDTPLSALKLTEILLEAGLPPEGMGRGATSATCWSPTAACGRSPSRGAATSASASARGPASSGSPWSWAATPRSS